MEWTPEAFADALSSGESDRVNRAVDAVKDMDLEERAAIFDEGFEVCRAVYENGDGYQRQSAIRLAAELYPRLAYRTVGAAFTDEALPGAYTVEDTATHRDRLRELSLEALVDDDGRVRRAAANACKELAQVAKMIEADDELRTMLEAVESLAAHQPESKAKHIERAYENVATHAEKVISRRADERPNGSEHGEPVHSMTTLERYRRYREVGQELNAKILDDCTDREAILESARLLGIERDGDAIRYEDEVEMTVHYEFLLNEYRQDGQTAVETYYEQDRWESEIERSMLEGLLTAEPSLFEITAIDAADKQLVVSDLLNAGQDAERTVTDVALSETVEPGSLLFFRPVAVDEFTMTSGVSFPFPADVADRLLGDYEQRTGGLDSHPESIRRFVAFFDLYRDEGIQIQHL